MSKNSKGKDHSKLKWFIEVFIITFVLSICFSYVSTNGVSNLNLGASIFILILVIAIGIGFDIIGVAVTATKKVKGAKTSIKLIKNSARVANICADVIGDICGVLSGAISAMIASKITEKFGVNLQFVISAMVASLTVGGKALGKEVANNNSTPIVHFVGTFLNKFHK